MKRITLLDTAVASMNSGDQIIMEAIHKHLRNIFKGAFFHTVPTHEVIFTRSYKLLKESDFAFVGGTNLLQSRLWLFRQWKISILDAFFVKNLILMGVGCRRYQKSPDLYSRYIYNSILSKDKLHSVRDNYTKETLKILGKVNVVNTGCPTLWDLSPAHCASIIHTKAENVLCTLSIYNTNKRLDSDLIKVLKKNYRKIYFWVQTAGDYEYAKEIDSQLEYLDPTLAGLDALLFSNEDIDYVGNRLHAGIRALQAKRRSIIVKIDNRAAEMGRDFNLVTVGRDEIEKLDTLINSSFSIKVNLNYEAINRWKSQFVGNQE